ncbi:transcriptional regulator [Desulfovibrio psychrotolerans]|uniref:Transcriptional regulator n=1 Tax=Desulfovibrio psychrotolerans TaxID=415242 RepID=A0A7J0BU41_9BACT|nr:transcriptional regulator [Desulfovibrio psychrotolerans]
MKGALEIVKAQASVRTMNEEEILSMVRTLADSIRGMSEGEAAESVRVEGEIDPKKSIREKSITCLECGKAFKIITRKHLAVHGLDTPEYREKWGMKKNTPLVCKALQRERRKKMKSMELWEKRRKQEPAA